MSPVEIPGSIMKFLTKAGKKKCPKCKQDYRLTKLRQKNGVVYKYCPNCNNVLARVSIKTTLRMNSGRRK